MAPSGQSVLPLSVGGSSWIDIDGPNGKQRIANPLYSYTFKPLNATAFLHGPVSFALSRSPESNVLTRAVEYLDEYSQKPNNQ